MLFVERLAESGLAGETMPSTPDGLLKFCRDVSFSNMVGVTEYGTTHSVPPYAEEYDQWSIPEKLKDDIRSVQRGLYGEKLAEEFHIANYRICW